MPLGSSSAAPVTSPGPTVFRTFRIQESRLPGPLGFSAATGTFVPRFAAILVAGLSFERLDCFFRAKSEKLLGRSFNLGSISFESPE